MNRSRHHMDNVRALYRIVGPVVVPLFLASGLYAAAFSYFVITLLAWFDQ